MNLNPGKTEFSAAELRKLVADVTHVRDFDKVTEAEIARQSEVPASTLNQFLKDRYTGDVQTPASKLHKWLQDRRRTSELLAQPPVAPSFQPLRGSRVIVSALSYAREAGRIVVVAGVPGVSKTATSRQFASETPRTWMVTLDPATTGVPNMLMEILLAQGEADPRGTPQKLARRIVAKACEAKCLLIIDEAQHASEKAIDQLRSMNDAARSIGARFGIAMVGNEAAYDRIGTAGTRAAFAQVSSRIAQRRWFVAPDPADVDHVSKAWADANKEVLGPKELAFLQIIAARPGGLRNVEMTFESALYIARGSQDPLSLQHLESAFVGLSGRDRAA